jgi:hypothetical protein
MDEGGERGAAQITHHTVQRRLIQHIHPDGGEIGWQIGRMVLPVEAADPPSVRQQPAGQR